MASEYAQEQRAKLDAKVAELRADGWDVVPRRARDLAWSERDDARDERDEARQQLADALKAKELAEEQRDELLKAVEAFAAVGLVPRAPTFIALCDTAQKIRERVEG